MHTYDDNLAGLVRVKRRMATEMDETLTLILPLYNFSVSYGSISWDATAH